MTNSNEENKSITVRGMAPLLQVFDMPTSIHFYRDIIGFEIIATNQPRKDDRFDWVLLRLNDAELMLNTAFEEDSRPPSPDRDRIIAHGDTAIYFGCPDVNAAYTHLQMKGIDVKNPEKTGYGFMALHVTDPDGFLLCFHWPVQQ